MMDSVKYEMEGITPEGFKVRSSDPKQGMYLNKLGKEIYDDCAEILSNCCETTAETRSHLHSLVDYMMEGHDELEIMRWLKKTTERIANEQDL